MKKFIYFIESIISYIIIGVAFIISLILFGCFMEFLIFITRNIKELL